MLPGRENDIGIRWISVLLLALTMLLGVGCDPGHTVVYENRTDHEVDILIDGGFDASVKPHSNLDSELIEFDEATFEARTPDGTVIYRRTFTWDQLKDAGWRIVVTESSEASR